MLLPLPTDQRPARFARLTFGLVLCGIGIGLQIAGDLGASPWDVFHQGVATHAPLSIGQVSIITGLFLLVLWIPLKERLGVGTIANAVIIGLVVDITLALVSTPSAIVPRAALMLVGPVIFGLGSGFYIGAGLGPGPRDGLMTGLARRGLPLAPVRTGIEFAALAIGFVLGGTIGIGTVWFAVSIGPVVAAVLPRLTVAQRQTGASVG